MNKHKVKIVLTGHGRGELFIDDEKVHNVLSVEMKAVAGETNELKVTLLASEIEVDGEFEVTNLESVAREYKKGPSASSRKKTSIGEFMEGWGYDPIPTV